MLTAIKWPSPLTSLVRSSLRPARLDSPTLFRRPLCSTQTITTTPRARNFLHSYRLAVAVSLPVIALGLGVYRDQKLECEGRDYAKVVEEVELVDVGGGPVEEPLESSVNVRDLGFGTVAGICVGVFVKKGLKLIAFTLGGVFVLLQYFSSRSLITFNWANINSSYDKSISRLGPPVSQGGNRAGRLWSTFVDFVGADIQGRATFVVGILLGFRLG